MKITEIRMFLKDEEKFKATLSLTFDNCFVVKGVKVIQGRKNVFIAMPSRRREDGRFEDVCHPINAEARSAIEKAILDEYARLCKLRDSGDSPSEGARPSSPPVSPT